MFGEKFRLIGGTSSEREKRGEGGVVGLFKGGLGMDKGLGFGSGRGDGQPGGKPCRRRSSSPTKLMTCGPRLSVRENGRSVPVRVYELAGQGRFWGWAEWFPHNLLLFSLFFFLFLISLLFHIFCNFDSNQIKQISKFF
jgi:hypothetical protein